MKVPLELPLIGLLLLCTIWPGAGVRAAPAPLADWTLLVYLDADNDLEKPMMRNLEEMVAAGGSEHVQLIVLAARSKKSAGKYTDTPVGGLADWHTTKLLRVERGRLRELEDWGERASMGNPDTLSRFLETATRDFPARRYGLILGDHGVAWAGVAVAESAQFETLSLDEVAAALAAITPTTGRFELIGFDACVMSNLEVARTLAPHARYLVASEEIEPADGWDYQPLLAQLNRAPTMDGAALGRVIIDTYRDYFLKSDVHERQEKARVVTLTLIDLDRMAAVDQALTRLGTTIDALLARGHHEAWMKLAHARHAAEEFGRSAQPPRGGVSPGMEVYDLVQLAEKIKEEAGDAATGAAVDAVTAAVRGAVRQNYRGRDRPHANGLSVFFPPNQQTLADTSHNTKGPYGHIDFSRSEQNRWYPFLSRYAAFPASDEERLRKRPTLEAPTTDARLLSKDGHVEIKSRVDGEEIEEASFVLSHLRNGEEWVIGSIPVKTGRGGALDEQWDGEWFSIGDGEHDFIAPITGFEELSQDGGKDHYWASVPAQLMVAGTDEWLNVTLSFVLDLSEGSEDLAGEFIYAVEYTRFGPREIDIEEGDELRMVYEVIDGKGEERLEPAEGEDNVLQLHALEDLKVERVRVHPGVYKVGFVIEDYEGRISDNFVEIDVR